MADLGVAHLALGQSDGEPRRFERGPGAVAEQLVEARFFRRGDGVVVGLAAASEAVEDDEDEKGAIAQQVDPIKLARALR